MKPPSLEIDILSDEHIADPYPLNAELRAFGPVVCLPAGGFYAVSRYADVRALLHDWQTFSSAHGSGFNEPVNLAQAGTTLASDPPLHDQLRKIIAPPLFRRGSPRSSLRQIAMNENIPILTGSTSIAIRPNISDLDTGIISAWSCTSPSSKSVVL